MTVLAIILIVLLVVSGIAIYRFKKDRDLLVDRIARGIYECFFRFSHMTTDLKDGDLPVKPALIETIQAIYGTNGAGLIESLTKNRVLAHPSDENLMETPEFIHRFISALGEYVRDINNKYALRILKLEQQNRSLSAVIQIYSIILGSEGLKDADTIKAQATDMLKQFVGNVPRDSRIFEEIEDLLRQVRDEGGTKARVTDRLTKARFMLASFAEQGIASLEPLKLANIETAISLFDSVLTKAEAEVAQKNFAAALKLLDDEQELEDILKKQLSFLSSRSGVYRVSPGVLMVDVEKIQPVTKSEDANETEEIEPAAYGFGRDRTTL